jgi:hypothetical protein
LASTELLDQAYQTLSQKSSPRFPAFSIGTKNRRPEGLPQAAIGIDFNRILLSAYYL